MKAAPIHHYGGPDALHHEAASRPESAACRDFFEELIDAERVRYFGSLTPPMETASSGGNGSDPDQLFAVACAACFDRALRRIVRALEHPPKEIATSACVALHGSDAGSYALTIELQGAIEGRSEQETLQLMREAQEVCPYLNAFRCAVGITLRVRQGS